MWEILQAKMSSLSPNLLASVLALIAGLALAFLARFIIGRLFNTLQRNLSRRGIATRFVPEGSKPTSYWLANVAFWMILLFTFTLITEILGLRVVTDWLGGLTNYLPKVFAGILVAFLGFVIAGLSRDLVKKTARSVELTYGEVLGKAVYSGVLLVTALVILRQLGIEVQIITGVVLIVFGAFLFGTALSFALGATTVVSDILSCYFLQKSYQEGDKVRIGDVEGTIIQITPTSVIIGSTAGKFSVPAKMFSEKVSVALKSEV